jgi:hypothetical protein
MHQPHISSGGRYPVLRTIAILWIVGGILALIGGVYQAICALVDARGQEVLLMHSGSLSSRVMSFFIWLAVTFFAVIMNIAIAELIKLGIDIEHNTRMYWMSSSPTEPAGEVGNGRNVREESAEAALIRGH